MSMQSELQQASYGSSRQLPGVPWRLDGTAHTNMFAAPLRGQYNAYVFEELLGLSRAEVEALVAERVIC